MNSTEPRDLPYSDSMCVDNVHLRQALTEVNTFHIGKDSHRDARRKIKKQKRIRKKTHTSINTRTVPVNRKQNKRKKPAEIESER